MISNGMDLLLPNIAYASVDTFVANVNRVIINPLILMLFAFAVAFFMYGLFQFLSNQDNDEKRTEGKSHMIYGVIGMSIMMGVFAIMGIVLNTFNISKSEIDPEKGIVNLKP
jgi:uncharacterized membrane protein YidH (DUF202 family)